MASYKQELIQLHQLLAEVRIHSKNELGLPTDIKNLDEYRKIGITSLDLNAEIDAQLDAILALASDLTDAIEAASAPERPSEKLSATPTASAGPTVKTTLHDVADGTTETAEVAASTAPGQDDGVTASADESADPRVVRGYDTDTSKPALCDTSLTDAWADVKEREDRKPVETWGGAETDDTSSEQVEIVTPHQPSESVETVPGMEPEPEPEDAAAEADEIGEQATLPTP